MIYESHPMLDSMSLYIVLAAAINYGVAIIFGFDLIAKLDPWSFGLLPGLVGLSGIWQLLRQGN